MLSLSEVRAGSAWAAYPVTYRALRAADVARVPIKAGEDQVSVTVPVVWSFG